MKILHICLANTYLEGMGYQENIITNYHVKFGHQVEIFTPEDVFDYKKSNGKGSYINDFGARVRKVIYKKIFFSRKIKIYNNLYNKILEFSPDIIFVHGGQFLSFNAVVRYVKNHKQVKMYIDQHADFYNTPINNLKRKIVAKYIFGHQIRKAVQYTERFWGVTPWRCEYLKEVYNIPEAKIGLLTMGGDDAKINFENKKQIRSQIRKKIGLQEDDFVIITGGKFSKTKNIHLLMQAVKELNTEKIKLVCFGSLGKMKDIIEPFLTQSNIKYIDWISANKVYDYFLSADLAVFPGTHSVLWEQACACGLPALFKKWPGMQHVKITKNCEFLCEDSVSEIKEKLIQIFSDKEKYEFMKLEAEKCRSEFFYSKISAKAIDLQ